MSNTIMDTGNVAEILDLGPDDEISNMSATHEATEKPMEFHVQMHGHTFRDMEALIVNAAAQQLLGLYGDSPNSLRKHIETKCVEQVTAKADAALAKVTAEIIDQPMMPKYTGAKDEPITMREFIGLTGRAYLMEMVDQNGGPATTAWGGNGNRPRIQHIVEKAMFGKFKGEIESATNAAIAEIRADIKVRHEAFLAAEKARFREALAKATA